MYMIRLDPKQVEAMYRIREKAKQEGIKLPITRQVHDAIDDYIKKNDNKNSLLTGTQKAGK